MMLSFVNPLVWLDSPFTMTSYLNGEGLALYAITCTEINKYLYGGAKFLPGNFRGCQIL